MYPQHAASDGYFYFHLGTPTGLPLLFSQGFGSVSVCAKTSSVTAHLTGGSAPIIVAGAPPPIILNPAVLSTIIATHGIAPTPPAAPTSYTWLWVLLGLGAVGVAGYYLID
jgi:hypothetical protein